MEEQPQPLTRLLSGLSHTEQIRLIMTHPFFTGRCPQCRHRIPLAKASLGKCKCPACDWSDQNLNLDQDDDLPLPPPLEFRVSPEGQAG
jgi:Zn finger protein HypA/HybF involved in hydrogenase expression